MATFELLGGDKAHTEYSGPFRRVAMEYWPTNGRAYGPYKSYESAKKGVQEAFENLKKDGLAIADYMNWQQEKVPGQNQRFVVMAVVPPIDPGVWEATLLNAETISEQVQMLGRYRLTNLNTIPAHVIDRLMADIKFDALTLGRDAGMAGKYEIVKDIEQSIISLRNSVDAYISVLEPNFFPVTFYDPGTENTFFIQNGTEITTDGFPEHTVNYRLPQPLYDRIMAAFREARKIVTDNLQIAGMRMAQLLKAEKAGTYIPPSDYSTDPYENPRVILEPKRTIATGHAVFENIAPLVDPKSRYIKAPQFSLEHVKTASDIVSEAEIERPDYMRPPPGTDAEGGGPGGRGKPPPYDDPDKKDNKLLLFAGAGLAIAAIVSQFT